MIDFKEVHSYSKSLKVLYVEDDNDVLLSTQSILESFFIGVDIAYDGVDGLEKYIAYKKSYGLEYDIVITDINMPRKNGLEMIKDIRELNPDQTIIIISAYNDADRLIKLIREGISNFITKPIKPDLLMQIIYKTSKAIYASKIKDSFLLEQSKLASMGKMIDTIAHQWQTPINLIKMQAQLLQSDIDDDTVDKESINTCIDKQSLQIEHIVQTLSEFRSFFRPSSEMEIVSVKELIDSVLILLKDNLIKNTVEVSLNIEADYKIKVIKNEFKHVLINLISNSIDEFINKKIIDPKITINCYQQDDHIIIQTIDNAGGIPKNIIDKIFDADFTTKADSDGTGIGLFLVRQIVKKINATIDAKNVKNGALFNIKLKKT